MLSHNRNGLIGTRHTVRDRHVPGVGERRVGRDHRPASPLDEARPHLSYEDQRRVTKVPDLKQLPDHHRFQDRADASRCDDEGIGGEHELVQAREERSMFERLGHVRIDVLFEG